MAIYNWDRDKESIVNNLSSHSPLKICVKVLDEPLLIEGWIQHHADIVGYENLIVADNGSTDPYTSDIYRRYSTRITIFQFDGPHNQIHWHPRFAEFFEIIRKTCQHFSFIDVDERLVRCDNDSCVADKSISQQIRENPECEIIPTTWLINVVNSFDQFSLRDSEYSIEFRNNLKWGKPILPARLVGIQPGIHNIQFDRFEFSTKFGCSFFLLHLTQFPERRIIASRNKLLSRGVIDKDLSNESIMSMNFDNHPDKTLSRFVKEMQTMHRFVSGENSIGADDWGDLKLADDVQIIFSDKLTKDTWCDFLCNATTNIRVLFGGSEFEECKLNDEFSLLDYALGLRERGDFSRAELLLRRGMVLYPGYLDQYESPAFRKELMRLFLARGDWTKAEQLVPATGDVGGLFWHQILFARQYSRIGDKEKALAWWNLVLKNEPHNGEARDRAAGP